MISGCRDGEIKLWDLKEAKCVFTTENSKYEKKFRVNAVALDKEEKFLIAGGDNFIITEY